MEGVVGRRPSRAARAPRLRDLLGFCRIHNPAMRSHASVHGLFVCLLFLFVFCFSLVAVRLTDDWETSDVHVRYSAHGRGRPCLGVRVLFGKVDGRKSRIDGICYAPVAVWVTSGRNPQHPWGSVCAGASCVSFTVSIESTSND